MDDKRLVKWQFDLIKDFARFAAAMLLGNELYDRIFNYEKYDSSRYLNALVNEGWSVKPNGSCEVMSLTFSSPEQRDEFIKRYAKGDRKIGSDGIFEAGESLERDVKKKHPILQFGSRGGDKNTVIIPLSEYERAYKVLNDMNLSHNYEGFPTRETTAYVFSDKDKADKFNDAIAASKLQKDSVVVTQHYIENGVEKTQYIVYVEKEKDKADEIAEKLGFVPEGFKERKYFANDFSRVQVDDLFNRDINNKFTFQSKTVIDPERGHELAIVLDHREGKNPGDPLKLIAELDAYNEKQKREGRDGTIDERYPNRRVIDNTIPYTVVEVNGELQVRIPLSKKSQLDEFNVSHGYDIDYFDPKNLHVSFDKNTNTLTFTRKEGELDYTYEFEAYLYTSGFTYAYDKESGKLIIDLNNKNNVRAIGRLLETYANDKTAQGDPDIESLFNEVYGDIDDELNRSGAQQFVFDLNEDDVQSKDDFNAWLDEQFGERAHLDFGERDQGSDKEESENDRDEYDEEDGYEEEPVREEEPERNEEPEQEAEPETKAEPAPETRNTRETTKATVLDDGPDTKYQRTSERTSDVVTDTKEGPVSRTETQISQEDSYKTTNIDQAEPAEVPSYVNPNEGFSVRGFISGKTEGIIDKCENDFEAQKESLKNAPREEAEAAFDAHVNDRVRLENFKTFVNRSADGLDEALKDGNAFKAINCFKSIKEQIEKTPEAKTLVPEDMAKSLQSAMLEAAEKNGYDLKDEINSVFADFIKNTRADRGAQEAEKAQPDRSERTSGEYINPREGKSAKTFLENQVKNAHEKSDREFEDQKAQISAGELKDADAVYDAHVNKKTAINSFGRSLDSTVSSLDKAFEEGNVLKAISAFDIIKSELNRNPELKDMFPGKWMKELQKDLLDVSAQKGLGLEDEINEKIGSVADATIEDELAQKAAEENIGLPDTDKSASLYDLDESDDYGARELSDGIDSYEGEEVPDHDAEGETTDEEFANMFNEQEEEEVNDRAEKLKHFRDRRRAAEKVQAELDANLQAQKEAEEKRRLEDAKAEREKIEAERKALEQKEAENKRLEQEKREREQREYDQKKLDEDKNGSYGGDGSSTSPTGYNDPYANFDYGQGSYGGGYGYTEAGGAAASTSSYADDLYRDTVSGGLDITETNVGKPLFEDSNIDSYVNAQPSYGDPASYGESTYQESTYQDTTYQDTTYQDTTSYPNTPYGNDPYAQPAYNDTTQRTGSSYPETTYNDTTSQGGTAPQGSSYNDSQYAGGSSTGSAGSYQESPTAEKAKKYAEQNGTTIDGAPNNPNGSGPRIASIGSGSAIPEVKIGIDRDYQINRDKVDSIHNSRSRAAMDFLQTLASPIKHEVENNETIKAAKNNAVIHGAAETSKQMLLGFVHKEASEMKAAAALVNLRDSNERFQKMTGGNSALSESIDTVNKAKGAKNQYNLNGALVTGMDKSMDKVMKDINNAAYSCGFKGFENIKDFNELCKNKTSLNLALNQLKREGVSAAQIKQLRELANMSKQGRMLKNSANASMGIKSAFAGGIKKALSTMGNNTANTFAQTESLGLVINGVRNINSSIRTTKNVYAVSKKVGGLMVNAATTTIHATSNAYMFVSNKLNTAILRNGSLKGAIKEAGMRFISTAKKVPGVVKQAPGILRKAPGTIGRLAGKGLRKGGRVAVAAVDRSLPARIIKAPFKAFGKAIGYVRKNGFVGTLKNGITSIGRGLAGGFAKIGSGLIDSIKNFFNNIKKWLRVIGIAFGLFVIMVLVVFFTNIGSGAAEAIKQAATAFNEYRNDVEDPRADTIIGLASEELKGCDVLYTEGLALFIGGLDTIDEVVSRLPFVGPLAHDAAMDGLDDLAANSDPRLYAYVLGRSIQYADEMISTEKSNTGQLGFTYFYDHRIGESLTTKEARTNVEDEDCIWIECDAYISDSSGGCETAAAERYTTPQMWTSITDMSSINNSICLQFVDGHGNPCGRMSNIKEILSLSVVCFTDSALGQEDFGDKQTYGIENGETIADSDIKAKAAAAGHGEDIEGVLGFFVMLGSVADKLGSLAEWHPVVMVVDVIAEVAEDIIKELIPEFPGFPDIQDPGKAFVQSSYCLAAYISSHKVYVGYRTDSSTGETLVISCDDECIPHFGYTDPNDPKKDALDHNACEMQYIYYVEGQDIHVAGHNAHGESWDPFVFNNGWAITAYPKTFYRAGYFAHEMNYGDGEWNRRHCAFITPEYAHDSVHPKNIAIEPGYEDDGYAKFMALCAEMYDLPPRNVPGTYRAYTCFGHPYIVVVSKTYTMNTGLFDIIEKNPYMRDIEKVMSFVEASMFDGQWEDDTTLADGKRHWTENNQEWAQWIKDGDWEKLYNLYVGNVTGGHYRIPTKMSITRIMGQLGPQNLSFERYYILYKALRTVGQIAYGAPTEMNKWIIYPEADDPYVGFTGYRYGHDGLLLERPKITVKMDQQGNQELPDHMDNKNYMVWLFASSNLDLLQKGSAQPESFYKNGYDTYNITAQCMGLGDKSSWAPGDIVATEAGDQRHVGIFLGYDPDGSHGYIIEEYAYCYDVDELVNTEQDGQYPDTPDGKYELHKGFKYTYSLAKPDDARIINAYGMVYLEKIEIAEWAGYRPKCYKYAPFRPDAIDNNPRIEFEDPYSNEEHSGRDGNLPGGKRTGRGGWDEITPGRNTMIYNSKDDQQQEYERWGRTH